MYEPKTYLCDSAFKMNQVVNLFMEKTKRKRRFGNFKVTADRIEYCSAAYEPEVIAVRVKRQDKPDLLLGNASVLRTVGLYSAYGSTQFNRKQTVIQSILEKHIPMLPFSVFKETGLDISEIQLIEQGPAETVRRKFEERDENNEVKWVLRDAHFTGASLFKLGDKNYLFDIDRNEIEHGIFNPFVVELPKQVKSIAEAYSSLKPKEVLKAEKQGLKVRRQGEWFFIPTDKKLMSQNEVTRLASACRNRWGELDECALSVIGVLKGQKFMAKVEAKIKSGTLPRRFELRAGKNRPNQASMGLLVDGVNYVSGIIKHTGREHADMDLGTKWHIAVPNTAQKSFTITGDID